MEFYFLLFSLFFPRITLLVYLVRDAIPLNTVPFFADALLAVFLPRFLILIYIYQNMGYENLWFVAHLVMLIFTYLGGGNHGRKRFWHSKEDK